MAEPKIAQKSPYVQAMEAGSYWWCRCGLSAQQPFCDGSHKGSDLAPVKVDLAEGRTVAWCGCKHSGQGAFCDGTHGRLS